MSATLEVAQPSHAAVTAQVAIDSSSQYQLDAHGPDLSWSTSSSVTAKVYEVWRDESSWRGVVMTIDRIWFTRSRRTAKLGLQPVQVRITARLQEAKAGPLRRSLLEWR